MLLAERDHIVNSHTACFFKPKLWYLRQEFNIYILQMYYEVYFLHS